MPVPGETIYGNVILDGIPTITGQLTVFGTLELSTVLLVNGANVTVVGNTTVSTSLTVQQGAILSTGQLFVMANATLSVNVPVFPPSGSAQQVVVATYSTVSGQFASVATSASSPQPSCGFSTTPAYGSSSLTVTIATSSCSTSLSTGALIGIIVGSVVAGIVVAIGIVLLIRFLLKRSDVAARQDLAAAREDSLKYELRKIKEY